MSAKHIETPKVMQIPGVKDHGMTLAHDYFTHKPLHYVHSVSVRDDSVVTHLDPQARELGVKGCCCSECDTVADRKIPAMLRRCGYTYDSGYRICGIQYWMWSKTFTVGLTEHLAAVEAELAGGANHDGVCGMCVEVTA